MKRRGNTVKGDSWKTSSNTETPHAYDFSSITLEGPTVEEKMNKVALKTGMEVHCF